VKNQLESLSNPEAFQSPIEIDNLDRDTLVRMLTTMIMIRKTEKQLL